ncbi:Tetratricopeptide repeat-containing protein [Maricaulis salignorans]|uniref:Tetratricopeptide repeat-containing protein n=2 Tax=Maricaulis salignorans TaxID=144026 RepID=A0A1G9RXZ7_9PROT|nr:Tetratricopeptide repeat-containing protein [Maricaulis salignorans]
MMRALIFLCLALSMASPAHAELRDLRARLSGQEGLIWIAFDGQPTLLRRQATASGLELVLEGVSVNSREIVPRDRDLVTAVQVEPTERGARIELVAGQAWATSEAELREGGVLVRVRLAQSGASVMPVATAYPATAPDWQPTPTTSQAPAAMHTAPPVARAPSPSAPRSTDPAVQPQAPAPTPRPTPAPAQAQAQAPAASQPPRASSMPAQAAAMAAAALPAGQPGCSEAAAAVEANPWDDASLMQHARCLSGGGDTASAIRIYEQMLAFEPENVTAALALADLRLQQGDRAAARTLYLRAARHANSDAEAMRARGQAEALGPE